MTTCPECNDTGQRDSGGTHPLGEPGLLPCDCKDAEIGRQWREDSSLQRWFPLTAERLAALEAQNAVLKRDLQYARDGLTRGRSRMREDNERLRAENAALKLEAHAWSKAAETYATSEARLVEALRKIEAGYCIDWRTVAREALGPNVRANRETTA